jgi:biotin transport system substrate-specific component
MMLHLNVAQAFLEGVAPFIIGDLIKLVVAAALIPSVWQLVRWLKPEETFKR